MGSLTTTTDSMMSSDVWSAQSLCRRGGPREGGARRRGGEQEREEEHVLPFYRGICACAEHVRVRAVPAMRAACLDKSFLACPCATLCASAFLQVIVAVSFQRPARDDNGNVEKKTVCSGLLQMAPFTTSKSKILRIYFYTCGSKEHQRTPVKNIRETDLLINLCTYF